MKIRDLDDITRGVVHAARVMAKYPSNRNLRMLKHKVDKYDEEHGAEMDENVIRAIWGPNGFLARKDKGGV